MEGYLICILFAWFIPGLPNFANTLLRAVFTNQGIYILPKVLIANMADFGNVTIFHLHNFTLLQKCTEASQNYMTCQTSCNTFFDKMCTVSLRNTELVDKDFIITS